MSSSDIRKYLTRLEKPGRYAGGEYGSIVKEKDKIDIRFAFCFPDIYEIGMSHLGMKILYSLLNSYPNIWCERIFAPWTDAEKLMREKNIPLFGLESGDSLDQFDIIGFTLQYELSYTNILNMLSLAEIPIKSSERNKLTPLVIGGGPCACNPEPLAECFDLFILGEAEEAIIELTTLLTEAKKNSWDKVFFLKQAAKIGGVYVPEFYDVEYNPDNTIKSITPNTEVPEVVTKRIIKNLDEVFYPEMFVIPFIQTVHDRAMLEIQRGCIRGCRFCQAGYIYRPTRQKSPDNLSLTGKSLCENTGYEEISISSLSTSDYTGLEELLSRMLDWSNQKNVSISLPSLRINNFSKQLLEYTNQVRKSSLTFAPEAGSQRLRDAINKNITEEEILTTCKTAFESGYTNVKLYFMIGLPTETDEDITAIAELAQKIVDTYYKTPNRPKGKSVKITLSVACFVPKPFTPFEREPQDNIELLTRKQSMLNEQIKTKKINYNWHDARTSFLEALLAKGDRRLFRVIERAWQSGCVMDSWDDFFDFNKWMSAFESEGIDPKFYVNRKRADDEILPWSHLDFGISRKFLLKERDKAYAHKTTPNCKEGCSGCGVNGLKGGVPCD